MKNISFLLLLAFLISCGDRKSEQNKSNERPNIIFLLADDQRWDALSYAGNTDIATPHIDKLAEKGIYFENAYVTTSICAVSRASILSGQYARRHNIWGFHKPFTEDQLANTYPLLLQKSGYITGFVGKYGVGDKLPIDKFDYWRGFAGQGTFNEQDSTGNPIHLTKKIAHQVTDFIEMQQTEEKPFCLSVSFKAPHVEGDPGYFNPDKSYAGLYKKNKLSVPYTSNEEYHNHFPRKFTENNVARNRWSSRFATSEMQQDNIRKYYQLIHGIDVAVGQIVNELKETGQDKNTVIIYTSDNGFYLGEYGLAGKWYGSDPSIKVPLIIYDPRNKSAASIEQKVLNIDLAPTMLTLANVSPPESMQGKDLTSLINNPEIKWRDGFFYEHLWQSSDRYYIPSTEGVLWKDKKYMKYFLNQDTSDIVYEELYDLNEDPHETHNLITQFSDNPLQREMIGRLQLAKNFAK